MPYVTMSKRLMDEILHQFDNTELTRQLSPSIPNLYSWHGTHQSRAPLPLGTSAKRQLPPSESDDGSPRGAGE